jgi:hypothetical protein
MRDLIIFYSSYIYANSTKRTIHNNKKTTNMCRHRDQDLLANADGNTDDAHAPVPVASGGDDDDELLSVYDDVNIPSPPPSPSFILIPTATAPEAEVRPKIVIDTSDLNDQDLDLLKKQDPFLYYSIPAVRTAAVVHSRDIDMSAIQGQDSRRVERQSRISFECHTDLLMGDLFETLDDMAGDRGERDLDFDSILRRLLQDARRGVA